MRDINTDQPAEMLPREAARTHSVRGLWQVMRPQHWIKNVFVVAPLVFAPLAFTLSNVLKVAGSFAIFCATASAIYIINDIADWRHDREHPEKRHRPIASGELSISTAAAFAAVLLVSCLVLSFVLSASLTLILLLYIVINLGYSFWLKHVVIIDVFCVASGFLLRIMAGAVVINVIPGPWILICTLLLALFLALGKRRHELILLQDQRKDLKHRPVLGNYSSLLVDQLITVVTAITILAYLLYTLDPNTVSRLDAPYLYTTGFFVILGVFRYLFIVDSGTLAGNPVELIFKDLPFLFVVVAWVLSVLAMIYLL
jgi:4-hydroxybenzoate polyprenyltransferase